MQDNDGSVCSSVTSGSTKSLLVKGATDDDDSEPDELYKNIKPVTRAQTKKEEQDKFNAKVVYRAQKKTLRKNKPKVPVPKGMASL